MLNVPPGRGQKKIKKIRKQIEQHHVFVCFGGR
jgi:hypothetical protein